LIDFISVALNELQRRRNHESRQSSACGLYLRAVRSSKVYHARPVASITVVGAACAKWKI